MPNYRKCGNKMPKATDSYLTNLLTYKHIVRPVGLCSVNGERVPWTSLAELPVHEIRVIHLVLCQSVWLTWNIHKYLVKLLNIFSTQDWNFMEMNRVLITHGLVILNGNGSGTIGISGPWSLSLSRTIVKTSTWCFSFHLVPLLVPVPFSCNVNIP